MKILILCFLPFLAFAQAPSPISNSHIIVYPGYGKLAEIKPDVEYKVPFAKKEDYKDIVFHRSQYDTAAEYELFFTMKKKTTTVPVIVEQIMDATDANAVFSGTWNKGPTGAAGWYGSTIAYSNTAGSTVSFTFTGRKIEVYGETLPTHGNGTIKVDNEAEVPVSFKSATKVLPAKIFERSWSTEGQHTIVLKVVSGYNLVDYFKVFKAQ